MAAATMRVVKKITKPDKTAITGSVSPIGFIDVDESISWTGGTHIINGYWLFKVPTGLSSGVKWAVQTASGVYTEDTYLNGGAHSGDDDLGQLISALIQMGE